MAGIQVRYLRKMINGVPVMATPAEIDITTAEQLRAVLLAATTKNQSISDARGGHDPHPVL